MQLHQWHTAKPTGTPPLQLHIGWICIVFEFVGFVGFLLELARWQRKMHAGMNGQTQMRAQEHGG